MPKVKKPNSVEETLRAARKLIAREEDWIKNAEKVKAEDREDGKNRPQFCAIGAVGEIDGRYEGEALRLLEEFLPDEYKHDGESSIPDFNDAEERTHADVLHLFDQAIAEARRLRRLYS
jgi:hypothetical protein